MPLHNFDIAFVSRDRSIFSAAKRVERLVSKDIRITQLSMSCGRQMARPKNRTMRFMATMALVEQIIIELSQLRSEMIQRHADVPSKFKRLETGKRGRDIRATTVALDEIIKDVQALRGRSDEVKFPSAYDW